MVLRRWPRYVVRSLRRRSGSWPAGTSVGPGRSRLAKGLVVLGILAGGAFAAWKWWDKQANPDWLVEPPAATEVPETGGRLTSVDGTAPSLLDPEVEAKEAESEAAEGDEDRR